MTATGGALFGAGLITAALVAFEVIAGFASGSLALFSDAAQNAVDMAALFLAWWGVRITRQPADQMRSFGYLRAPILVAFSYSVVLIMAIVQLAWMAVERFLNPVTVQGDAVALAGVFGLVVNLTVVWLLHSKRHHLHVQGAFLHNVTDAAASIVLIVSGLLISYTGAAWIDLVLSLGICAMLAVSLIPSTRKAIHILLEGTPSNARPKQVEARLAALRGVVRVHDTHTWSVAEEVSMLTCHVEISSDTTHEDEIHLLDEIRAVARNEFGLTHVTVQIERQAACPDAHCLAEHIGSHDSH